MRPNVPEFAKITASHSFTLLKTATNNKKWELQLKKKQDNSLGLEPK